MVSKTPSLEFSASALQSSDMKIQLWPLREMGGEMGMTASQQSISGIGSEALEKFLRQSYAVHGPWAPST